MPISPKELRQFQQNDSRLDEYKVLMDLRVESALKETDPDSWGTYKIKVLVPTGIILRELRIVVNFIVEEYQRFGWNVKWLPNQTGSSDYVQLELTPQEVHNKTLDAYWNK